MDKNKDFCSSYNWNIHNDINFSDSSHISNINLNDSDFEIFKSWGNIDAKQDYDSLPQNLKNYIKYIEEYLGIPIKIISLGPERNQTIIR